MVVERLIIGLTGPSAGGKGTVAQTLKERGFTYFSLSDLLREEVKKRKWSEIREVLEDLGDELRMRFGNDILAKRIALLSEFKHADFIVVDSIRHPAELIYFRDVFEAIIIGVTTSPEKLLDRMNLRGREGDPKTEEELKKMLQREEGPEGSPVMQVQKCLEMADIVIQNDEGKTDLKRETEKVLHEFGIGTVQISREHERHHH